MFHLRIDTRRNTVCIEAPLERAFQHKFTRRWEAALLAALLDQGRLAGALAAETLQARLSSLGQSNPLNRAQLQRLLDSLEGFFTLLPELHAVIDTPPRKRTVGPWHLVHHGALSCSVDDQHSEPKQWPHAGLVKHNNIDALHVLLSELLVADALAVEGQFDSALHSLKTLDTSQLTAEGQCLWHFRLCNWYRHVGNFKAARSRASAVLALPVALDPGLVRHAQFFLQRIEYDENPAQHWEALWQSTAAAPSAPSLPSATCHDWRSLCEWHNLRALLARRRMQQLSNPQNTDPQDAEIEALHQLALRHLQAALYLALWSRDWNTLQAYVANLAFHLQTCLSLPAPLGVTPSQVLDWHRLTMAYEDKLGAGRDSAWEYIFFGEFWLNHHDKLQPGTVPDKLAHHLGNTSPDQQSFYAKALERLRECGDDRQVAIGHSLYLRFAQKHMQGDERSETLLTQTQQLARLLESQTNGHLIKTLVAEGYAAHWPATLPRKARRLRRASKASE